MTAGCRRRGHLFGCQDCLVRILLTQRILPLLEQA